MLGAASIVITFSRDCNTNQGYDYLQFYRDAAESNLIARREGPGPWDEVVIQGDSFTFAFTTNASDNSPNRWGYNWTAVASDPASAMGGDEGPLPKSGPITNYVKFKGFLYATLDNTDPGVAGIDTQKDFIELPSGWEVAPNDPALYAKGGPIVEYGWGTHVLVVADGTSWGGKNYNTGTKYGDGQLLCEGRKYKPKLANFRILIRRKVPTKKKSGAKANLFADGFHLGGDATLLFAGEGQNRSSVQETVKGKDETTQESPDGGADVKEDTSGDFVVRQSTSALSWLQPGVLAGEVSVDFMDAKCDLGNLAIGLAAQDLRSLWWPLQHAPNNQEATNNQEAKESEPAASPEPPQPEQPPLPTDFWACPRCTYHNEESAARCSMCDDAKPASTGPVPAATPAPETPQEVCPFLSRVFVTEDSTMEVEVGATVEEVRMFWPEKDMLRTLCEKVRYDPSDRSLHWNEKQKIAEGENVDLPEETQAVRYHLKLDGDTATLTTSESEVCWVLRDKGKGVKRDEGKEEDLALFWRCDGSALNSGSVTAAHEHGEMAETTSFGAGDTLSVLATVGAGRLQQVEWLRNGKRLGLIELPGTGLPLPDVDEENLGLSLSVAFRATTACVSLLPQPQYQEFGASASTQPLSDAEKGLATNVFTAMDANRDGSLSKDEIAAVLGGCRNELFSALDEDASGQVSADEWLQFLERMKHANGSSGLQLFLESFRKKLAHLGRVVFGARRTGGQAWGLKVKATPRGIDAESGACVVRETMPKEWSEFMRSACEGWTHSDDGHFLDFIEWRARKKGKNVVTLETLEIADLKDMKKERAKELNESTRNVLSSDERVLGRYLVVRALNRLISDWVLPFVDFANLSEGAAGPALAENRHIIFSDMKRSSFDRVVRSTFTSEKGMLKLNRQKALECTEEGACDFAGERMLFGQATEEPMPAPSTFRASDRPFEVKYEGEAGIDAGGLYRDFYSASARELMSAQLPLLIPTPNCSSNSGDNRDAWTVSPSPITSATKRMLCFLGQLMGVCVRRGDVMPLCLGQLTWKLLLDETPDLEDLHAMDVATSESTRNLLDLDSLGIASDMFEDCFGEMFFTYHNTAGEDVPLVPNGGQIKVTYETAKDFAEKVIQMRLYEAREQVGLIRAGMATVIPVGFMALWRWQDLEAAVCGRPEVDISLMRKKVVYNGVTESQQEVQFLWRALEEFSQEDRQNFLAFCWGRSRLPPSEDSSQWGEGFKICAGNDLPQDGLPRAHTCFFQIDLPSYSTFELCKARVLYAVRNCRSMQNS